MSPCQPWRPCRSSLACPKVRPNYGRESARQRLPIGGKFREQAIKFECARSTAPIFVYGASGEVITKGPNGLETGAGARLPNQRRNFPDRPDLTPY
jgi:hypothetical protein